MFKPNEKPREYGSGYDSEGYKKTFYTFHFGIILIVILVIMLVK